MYTLSVSSRSTCTRKYLLGQSAIAALFLFAGQANAQTVPAASSTVAPGPEDAERRIDTVTVTATRRETTLQEAPLAVSSISGDDLKDKHLQSVIDLSGLVPGLQVGSSYSSTRLNIRGIGTNDITGGADPGVSFHLNGVFLGVTGPAANAFYDVSRVEVLRGPQGTLFGRNATGGSVNVITARPDTEFSGELGGMVGFDPQQYGADGYVTGKLNESGSLAGRLSFRYGFNEGYIENLADVGPDRFDDDDSYGLRAQLLFAPTDTFKANLALEYNHKDTAGQAYVLIGGPDLAPIPAEDLGGIRPALDSGTTYAERGFNKGEFMLATLDTLSEFEHGNLKTIVSAGKFTADIDTDGDGTAVDFTNTFMEIDGEQLFAEAIYDLDSFDRFNAIIGVNAFYQQLYQRMDVPILGFPAPVQLRGEPFQTTSYAAFVNADYQLSDIVNFFGGVRYTFDRKAVDDSNNFVGTLNIRENWDQVTYEVGLGLDLGENLDAYIKHGTGFKSGGFQIGNVEPPVDPETNASTEIGLKGVFFDGSMSANLAAFHMKYDDLQIQQVTGFTSGFKNAAKATINGLEAEVTWLPTDNLRIEFNGTLLDATFDDFASIDPANPLLGIQDLSGNNLRKSPKSSYSLGSYYDHSAGRWGTISAGGRYYWQDEVFFSEFNLPVASNEAIGRLDLSLDLVPPGEHWTVGLFARNVTDERVRGATLVVSSLLGSAALALYEPGRSVGVSARREF